MASVRESASIQLMGLARNGGGFDLALGAESRLEIGAGHLVLPSVADGTITAVRAVAG